MDTLNFIFLNTCLQLIFAQIKLGDNLNWENK